MTEITSQYVPTLTENLSISSFDKHSYLVCIDKEEPVKFKISLNTKLLIEQIDGVKKVEDIAYGFNKISGSNLSAETIMKIIRDDLSGYGVLQNDGKGKIKIKDNYLRLRINLFSKNAVKYFVSFLLFLFNKDIFKYTFLGCSSLLAITFFYKLDLRNLYTNSTFFFTSWFIILNILGIILHELGHAGACERFGAKTGAIGFGFYLFTPVFYADVSDVWRLQKTERLIVDLAGIYMQLIFSSILTFVYFFSKNEFYLNTAFFITTTLFININPFLRFDGYWALSDITNIANLRETSDNILKQFLRWLTRKQNTWKVSGISLFLLIYAILSSAFIFCFFIMMILYNRNSVMHFPINLFSFIKQIVTNPNDVTFTWIKLNMEGLILPFFFYLFLGRLLKKKISNLCNTKNDEI